MVIGGVVDSADGAVGLDQRVLPLDDVTVARLPLALLVAGVPVGDAVVELVAGVGLPGGIKAFFDKPNIQKLKNKRCETK